MSHIAVNPDRHPSVVAVPVGQWACPTPHGDVMNRIRCLVRIAALAAVAASSLPAAGAADQARRAQQLQGVSGVPRAVQEGHGARAWPRSTPRAACSAARSRSCRATTTATPGDAVRVAEELLSREKVVMLMGTFASNVGLAVADLAKQRKVLFLAAEPLTDKIVWDSGNKYTFRLRASTYMQTAMLVPEAAKLGKKRWAIVYPELRVRPIGHRRVQEADDRAARRAASSSSSRRCRSARSTPARSCRRCSTRKPDAIFSSLFGPDLARFVREGAVARPVQGSSGVQPAGRRARVSRSAEGRGAGRLVGHGLPVVRDRHRRAQALSRCLPGEVQRLSAPGLGRRLQRGEGRGRGDPQGRLDRHREARRGDERPRRSIRRSARSRSARSTTSRRWAPTSAARRSRTARA